MPNNFEEILSYSFNMPKTVGQATLELSQLLLKEESGKKLNMDESRKKQYLMRLVQEMMAKGNTRVNISEYYTKNKGGSRRRTRKTRRNKRN